MNKLIDLITDFNWLSVILRLVLAVVLGGCIGSERGRHGRAAGLRTHILICVGAAMTSLTGLFVSETVGDSGDVFRISAQVISGIGFLGVGTILVRNNAVVTGLTTAAGLWASACMGLAIGAGFYECAIFGFLLILITTTIFNKLGAWVIANARNMDLYVEFDRMDNLGEIISTIKSMNIQIFDVDTHREKQSNGVVIGAVISMGLPKNETHSHVMSKISKFDYVTLVDEI